MTDAATLPATVHQLLLARGETVATAESLTGGAVGVALTSSPGSSSTYRGGVIVYATDLKAQLAGVPVELLAQRGAVDPDVAAALAAGVREKLGATWGIGLTGVAGPEVQDARPVGTVFIGLAGPVGPGTVTALTLSGDRDAIRAGAVEAALRLLRDSVAGAE